MRDKYFPPKFKEKKFHCIHCGVYATQDWYETWYKQTAAGFPTTGIYMSVCSYCDKWTFWYEEKMIIPTEAPVEPPHPDLPEDCKQDYIEARDVFVKSPRAAAALLRLCIQELMPSLGEKGENINDDIKSLVAKGLPVRVQQALDLCRVIGNNAVHPGELDINDSPDIAQNLFNMINFIVEERITRPREIEELYNQLPEESRKKIEKRDSNR